MCGCNKKVKMDKWKYTEIFDLKWEISLNDRCISYWWKYERESFKMVQSCLDESNGYINEKKMSWFTLREGKNVEEDKK